MPIPAQQPAGHPPAYTPFQYPAVPPIDKSSFANNPFPGAGLNIPMKTDMSMPPVLPNLPSDKELNVNYTVSQRNLKHMTMTVIKN